MADNLTAISVLLVFISVAFSLLMPKIWKELEWDIDKNIKENEAIMLRLKAVNNILYFKVIPFAISCLLIAYLLLPTTVDLANKSDISLWNFDLFNTLFIVIHVAIIIMTVVIVKAIIDLIKRRQKLLHLTNRQDYSAKPH